MMTREQKIKLTIEDIYNEYVGGWTNMTYDYEQGTEEYNNAVNYLHDPASLINIITNEIMNCQNRIIFPENNLPFRVDGSFRFYGKENTKRLVKEYVEKHTTDDGEMW